MRKSKSAGTAGAVPPKLLLEEVFEGGAGVVGFRCGRRGRSVRGVGDGRRIFLHGHAKFEKRAVVLGVFFRNAFGNRLRALELFSGIEVDALLAGMQLEIAARARGVRIEPRR